MITYLIARIITPLLLRTRLFKLGVSPRFAGKIFINNGKYISFGDNVFVGDGVYISTNKYTPVVLGDAVMLGPRVMILGGNHDLGIYKEHMRFNSVDDNSVKSIDVENGAWIGAQSILLSGTNIGEGSVVGAGSVVNKRVPPYAVAVGNPIRIAKCRYNSVERLSEALQYCNSKYTVDEIIQEYKRFHVEIN